MADTLNIVLFYTEHVMNYPDVRITWIYNRIDYQWSEHDTD